jgi:hypothetical protein
VVVRVSAHWFVRLRLLVLLGVAALIGCAEGDSDGPETTLSASFASSSEAPDAAVQDPGYAPPDPSAQSLRRMIEWQPYIVVGRVASQDSVFLLQGDIPYTVYSFEVSRELTGLGTAGGKPVTLAVLGGPGPDGDLRPFQVPVEVGETYLLFLYDLRNYITGFPGFAGEATAKFRVTASGLVVPNGLEGYPGPREISGTTPDQVKEALAGENPLRSLEALASVTLDDAIAKIEAVIAEAPLPGWPPPWSPLSRDPAWASPSPPPAQPPSPEPTRLATPEAAATATPLASP